MFAPLRFFGLFSRSRAHAAQQTASERELLLRGHVDALHRVQGVVEFALDGTILNANQNFLRAMGYTLPELQGRNHSIFVHPGYEQTDDYRTFWDKLRSGRFDQGEYKRRNKAGQDVWLLASYNPVFDQHGRLHRIIKFATDVTQDKLRNAEFSGQMQAIHRVQGVVEFALDGTILNANPLFLNLMGYSLPEVQGKHHSIFVQPGEERTTAYQDFWRSLRNGNADTCVYKRFGKDGRVVWIQASYNPIFDLDGKPAKIVKFATDLTSLINETESTQRTAERVATATAAMSRSIAEISSSMALSRTATDTIMSTARQSGEQATQLLASMESMANIVSLIRSIAGKIDLLSLNAAIEAARAGAAGRGFAVVATEVKLLSNQTSQANEEIAHEIATVQSVSTAVAHCIRQSLDGVALVNQYVSDIAHAIEQQSAAIKQISRHSEQTVAAVESILSQTRREPHTARAA